MSKETTLSRRGLFMKMGILFNGLVATALAVPIVRFLFASVTRGRANAYLSWVPLGSVNEFPEGETRLATFRNPLVTPDRRQDCGHGMLGAAHRGRSIPGIRYQLRAPGLSGPMVSAIRSVHVPVPRRSVLSRRLACVRSAGARTVRVSVQSAKRSGLYQAGELPTPGAPSAALFGNKPPCA